LTATWRPPRRPDRNRVEPGDSVGLSIRIPLPRLAIVADLLAPDVPRERVLALRDSVTVYPTIGWDTLNGRRVRHRWVNVLSDPPAGVPPETGLGGLACIGAPADPINRMWRRHGQVVVPGRLWLRVDRDACRARARIVTRGGTLTADATFQPVGEPWEVIPQHYYLMDPARPIVFEGDEWGTTYAGGGQVEFLGGDRIESFDADVNVDLDLGWDYTFGT
jgi:hypothetical protein